MINFRYHVVSMIAVFLALGIGVIMGTAVIDRAVVDRLERQQEGLQSDVDEVRAENNRLREELRVEREASRQLADEGSERLLDDVLLDVPVLIIANAADEADGHDDLVSLLTSADSSYLGTIWFTDRFALDAEEERRDLAAALSFDEDASAGTLRSAAVNRVARSLRPAIDDVPPGPGVSAVPEGPAAPALPDASDVVATLREAGFVDFEPAEESDEEGLPTLDPSTRIVVVSGPEESGADRRLLLPLVRSLQTPRPDLGPVRILAATGTASTGDEADTFLEPIRDDDELRARVSTVDGIDDFAGRVASVLAIADLGAGRVGHYGRGAGSERLLPAPAE